VSALRLCLFLSAKLTNATSLLRLFSVENKKDDNASGKVVDHAVDTMVSLQNRNRHFCISYGFAVICDAIFDRLGEV